MRRSSALPTVLATALALVLAASGCGYRIVRNSDVTARRFAQDSAAMSNLRTQLVTLQTRCRADSVRLESMLVAQRATASLPPLTPEADSLLRARTLEVATLKDQLAKVSAELERIKRRLSNPRG